MVSKIGKAGLAIYSGLKQLLNIVGNLVGNWQSGPGQLLGASKLFQNRWKSCRKLEQRAWPFTRGFKNY